MTALQFITNLPAPAILVAVLVCVVFAAVTLAAFTTRPPSDNGLVSEHDRLHRKGR